MNLNEVDHIDSIRTNNSISNLRWVSSSDNQKNKGERVNALPENCVPFISYRRFVFENYFINQDTK